MATETEVLNETDFPEIQDEDIVVDEAELSIEATEGPFDVVLLYCEADRQKALNFRDFIEKFVLLKDGQPAQVCMYDEYDRKDLPSVGNQFQHLDLACNLSTYMFMFMSRNFVDDAWGMMQTNSALMGTINDPTKKWCLIPVHTKRKNSQDYTTPFCLAPLRGIYIDKMLTKEYNLEYVDVNRLTEEDINVSFIRNVRDLLNMRLGIKHDRQRLRQQRREIETIAIREMKKQQQMEERKRNIQRMKDEMRNLQLQQEENRHKEKKLSPSRFQEPSRTGVPCDLRPARPPSQTTVIHAQTVLYNHAGGAGNIVNVGPPQQQIAPDEPVYEEVEIVRTDLGSHTEPQQHSHGKPQSLVGAQQSHMQPQQSHMQPQQSHMQQQQSHIQPQQSHIQPQQSYVGTQKNHIQLQHSHMEPKQRNMRIPDELVVQVERTNDDQPGSRPRFSGEWEMDHLGITDKGLTNMDQFKTMNDIRQPRHPPTLDRYISTDAFSRQSSTQAGLSRQSSTQSDVFGQKPVGMVPPMPSGMDLKDSPVFEERSAACDEDETVMKRDEPEDEDETKLLEVELGLEALDGDETHLKVSANDFQATDNYETLPKTL